MNAPFDTIRIRTPAFTRTPILFHLLLRLTPAIVPWTPIQALGDQIVVDGQRFNGARVVGFENGLMQFRSAIDEVRLIGLEQVDMMQVEGGEARMELNHAERAYATGDWSAALLRYQRAARLSDSFWYDLIAARQLLTCDRAGRFDESVAHYLRLLQGPFGGVVAAARFFPRNVPGTWDAASARALERLDTAVSESTLDDQRAAIELLRFALLHGTSHDRSVEQATRLTALEIPESLRTERIFEVVSDAFETLARERPDQVDLENLDRVMKDAPISALPGLLLLKGRALVRSARSPEDLMRAVWPFLRVAIHMPGDPRAADGLLAAAEVLERLHLSDQAAQLARECSGHKQAVEATRAQALALIRRVEQETATSGKNE